MDSPEPSKNNHSGSCSASALNNVNSNDSLLESPPVQVSPFLRYVSTLSPITIKASRVGQGFSGLSSPPLVFKSPHISHRETQFVGRHQGTQSLDGEISQSGNGGNCLGEAPADSRKSNSQQPLPEGSITDTQKDFDSKNDANTQNNSSSSSIEQYFVDPGDIDQMYSADQDVEQSTDAAETSLSDLTQSKKNILKFDRKDGTDGSDKAEESLPLSDNSNKVLQEKSAYGKEPEKMEGETKDVEWTSQDPPNLESNLAADVYEKQYSHNPLPQLVENNRWDHRNCTPQWVTDPPLDVKGCEDYNEMVSTSHATSENILTDGSEALKYHGNRRRCLQFGEAASKALVSNKSYVKENATSCEMKMVKLFEPVTFSFPQQGSGKFPVTDPRLSHVKQNATSSKMKMVKLSEPITSLFSQGGNGNFPVTGPKPSGIGLHLNSIINAIPTGQAANTGVRLSDGSQGMKHTSSIRLQRMENVKRCILQSNADGKSLVDTRNESHEIDASVATDSFVSESPGMTEPGPLYSASTHDKRKLNPINAANSEELNQPPSECKKKKKASATADGNGCKGCGCKKSKCLKLYCDCFALGLYCTDPCACQGCLNRPEYAETVFETKQQIESRDPTAFAPKIVQPNTDNKDDINMTTPASARHKRGCNCKRSMCLKKYCECYQANVGCSSGCRCEGCKNVYGKKEDCVPLEQHALSKERVNSDVEKRSDSLFNSKLEMVARKMGYDHSPITPSFQCSDQGKEASKSRVISGNYLPSPAPDVNMFLPHHANYTKSSENLHSSQSFLEANDMSETAPYDLQNNCNNVNMMDQSSPSNPVSFLLELTPLSNPEPSGSISQIPGSSLRWRSSPVTPSTRVGEAQYLQCPESDIRLFDIEENDTPDILQEASTPMTSVKVNSPTQKRVSPPQSRHYGIGSSSSGGLRNGRKFILKAVPSFPPLSPCVDSKGNDNEDLGNTENK